MNRKITGEIFQVGGEGFTTIRDAAIYLVKVENQAALIDSGCGDDVTSLFENIRSCNVQLSQVQLLLLTHCHFDHTGGARELREKLGCRVIAHRDDAVYIEAGDSAVTAADWYGSTMKSVIVDRKLGKSEENIIVGGKTLHAFHIPGHSPGSVVYMMESDHEKVLFGQDVHGPLHPALKSDRAAYKESLKLLLSLEADILCEGHYGVIEGKKRVSDFIQTFL